MVADSGLSVSRAHEEKEAKRQAVNHWIRTSGAFDGVIDFEGVLGDQSRPASMRGDFDSGDHLHPNDAGYKAMGESIDLKLFQQPPATALSETLDTHWIRPASA